MSSIKPNPRVLLLGLWNFFRSSNIKKRNRISDRGDPYVTDLVLQVCQLLRQDLQELIDGMEEVEPWDEG